ncbi:MAG: arylsulfatase, partial [Planctomycetia bacterium]|nr:arylsulfatase [Planctomycetia bacterium]
MTIDTVIFLGGTLMRLFAVMTATLMPMALSTVSAAETKQPNILVIWGDDIGQFNVSAYNMGMMG